MSIDIENLKKYKRNRMFEKLRALLLVLPLLIFLILFFIVPIGFMLVKSLYNPKVAVLVPNTIIALSDWEDYQQLPSSEAYKALSFELQQLANERLSGRFAEEVNRRMTQTGSLIKKTARNLKAIPLENVSDFKQLFFDIDERWQSSYVWQGIKIASNSITKDYFLNSLDYDVTVDGKVVKREVDRRIYIPLFKRTFLLAGLVTLLTLLLGYPVAYYLSQLSNKHANLLLIFVLLPFWTSLLARTTSWIVILQNNGVVNKSLLSIGLIDQPLNIIYNQFATGIAMTHILLPFMLLPIYSVTKGIDPSYMKASLSLGANPFRSFIRVFLPLSLPGISAGALLVFILAIGYYITPALLGGVDGQLISNIIAHHMRTTNNWELAAALGTVLLILITILYWIYDKLVGASNLKL